MYNNLSGKGRYHNHSEMKDTNEIGKVIEGLMDKCKDNGESLLIIHDDEETSRCAISGDIASIGLALLRAMEENFVLANLIVTLGNTYTESLAHHRVVTIDEQNNKSFS